MTRSSFLLSHLSFREKFYFLKGRERICFWRKERKYWSQEKIKIAEKVADILRKIPWIKMIGITGSLALENARENDDIDLLVVTSKRRLWLTRALTVFLTELFTKRRRPGDRNVKDKICLNMFLDEEHLSVPKKERDLFSAHEVCQMRPIFDREGTYRKFLKSNLWTKKFLANNKGRKKPKETKVKKSKIFGSFAILGFLVDILERFAYMAQLAYMKPKKTSEVVEPFRACFHPQDVRIWVLNEFKRRQKIFSIDF